MVVQLPPHQTTHQREIPWNTFFSPVSVIVLPLVWVCWYQNVPTGDPQLVWVIWCCWLRCSQLNTHDPTRNFYIRYRPALTMLQNLWAVNFKNNTTSINKSYELYYHFDDVVIFNRLLSIIEASFGQPSSLYTWSLNFAARLFIPRLFASLTLVSTFNFSMRMEV